MELIRFYLVVLPLCFMSSGLLGASGLDPDKRITQYRLESWTRRDGLPGNNVEAVSQTPDGYLWLGSNNGLARFDGVQFSTFQVEDHPALGSNRIMDLAVTSKGRLWILTLKGLSYYEDGVFHKAILNPKIQYQRHLAVDENDHLWLGCGGEGIFRMAPDGSTTNYRRDSGLGSLVINNLVITHNGTLVVASNYGAYQFDGQEFKALYKGPVMGVWVEDNGLLWANNFLEGLYRVSWDGEPEAFDSTRGLDAKLVNAIHEDHRGNLWFATDVAGLGRYSNGHIETLNESHGLASNRVNRLFEDRDGNLWLACENGLSVLKPGLFTTYTEREGLSKNSALTVFEDAHNNLWCGSSEGLTKIQPDGTLTSFGPEHGFLESYVRSIAEAPGGDLWLGTYGGGLYMVRDDHLVPFEQNQNPFVYTFGWHDGSLWVGSEGPGLHRFEDELVQEFKNVAGEQWISHTMLAHSDGSFWIGSKDEGLVRWKDGHFDHFNADHGLPSYELKSLFEDGAGRLWVLSGGLLCLFQGETFHAFPLEVPKTAYFTGIAEDGKGYLWLNSFDGVYRVKLSDLEANLRGELRVAPTQRFGLDHGLLSETGGNGSPNIIQSDEGLIWIATKGGAAVVDPNQIPEKENLPPLYIERVFVDDAPMPLSRKLVLPPGKPRIQFFFTAVDLNQPERLRFRYRMDPYDEQWIEVDRRDVLFNGLPPGDYRFRVGVSYDGRTWREAADPVRLRLSPYFYQTSWFYPACFISFLVIGLAFFGYRVRNFKMRARELQSQVDERTASLRTEKEKTQELYEKLRIDNVRKTRELEEARRLQLAMLPESPPDIPGLSFGLYMKTATEVGGDYYDFLQDEHGALTVAVGDATGHGMKAGLLVATTKSYFHSYGLLADSREIVNRISKSLKNLKLKGMFMALSLLKYHKGKASLLAAGMPPALIWRKENGAVEPLILKGLPLGGFLGFPYKVKEFELFAGDVMLLMSDGLPERFNREKKLLGEARIQTCFSQCATHSPQAIIEALVHLGEDWSQGVPQDDDIALIVMKVDEVIS